MVAPGNPLNLSSVGDLAGPVRTVIRPPESGARVLTDHLLERSGVSWDAIDVLETPARTELEVGLAILDGRADAGIAVRAVARQLRLDFVPLHRERYDLVMRRRDYFEPDMQTLLTFARGRDALARAEDLLGYDLSTAGKVWFNAP